MAKQDSAATELATIQEEMAAMAETMAAGLKVSSDKISTQNKAFKMPDGTILGPSMKAVVLGFAKSHSFYENEQFDPNKIQEPICFSDSVGEEEEIPASSVDKPFAPTCAECEHNQFGTAQGGAGKGKRCKEEYRIAVVPEGYSEAVILNIPPTGIKAFSNTMKSLITSFGMPVKAMCTFEFNPNVQFSQPVIVNAEPNTDEDAAKYFAMAKEINDMLHRS